MSIWENPSWVDVTAVAKAQPVLPAAVFCCTYNYNVWCDYPLWWFKRCLLQPTFGTWLTSTMTLTMTTGWKTCGTLATKTCHRHRVRWATLSATLPGIWWKVPYWPWWGMDGSQILFCGPGKNYSIIYKHIKHWEGQWSGRLFMTTVYALVTTNRVVFVGSNQLCRYFGTSSGLGIFLCYVWLQPVMSARAICPQHQSYGILVYLYSIGLY